ncbi:hypothetical protein ACHWQZ_G015844 [Mnemiopsis leidyi]
MTDIMCNTPEGLQETTDNIAKYCGVGGLKMNAKKTESIVFGKDASQHPLPKDRTLDITVDGNPVKQVTQFTYLGATITSDGKIEKEMSVRIGKATGAFNQLNNIWKNKNISINNKVRMYVAGVITNGCEPQNVYVGLDMSVECQKIDSQTIYSIGSLSMEKDPEEDPVKA